MPKIDDKIRNLHHEAYLGRCREIPLNIFPPPVKHEISLWEAANDPGKALDRGLVMLEGRHGTVAGWIPVIANPYGDILVPDLFGARTTEVPGLDSKPMCYPCVDSLSEALRHPPKSLDTHWVEQARRTLSYLGEQAPEDVYVLAPSMYCPLDYALNMRGGDFLMEMLLEPRAAYDFLSLLTELTIELIQEFKRLLNEPEREMVTIRGHCFPGIRLACDSVVNLSPQMIEEFMFPLFERFEKAFGPVLVHCCTEPAEAGHVFSTVEKCPAVMGFDSWQGVEFHQQRGWLAGPRRLSIAADFRVEQWPRKEELESLCQVGAHSEGGRGLLLSTLASSSQMAADIVEAWQL
jgi:hypothetical protein